MPGALTRCRGNPGAARAVWREARIILDQLDQPAGDQVRARLHQAGR